MVLAKWGLSWTATFQLILESKEQAWQASGLGPTGHKGPHAGCRLGRKTMGRARALVQNLRADLTLPRPKPEEEIVKQRLEGGEVQAFKFKGTCRPSQCEQLHRSGPCPSDSGQQKAELWGQSGCKPGAVPQCPFLATALEECRCTPAVLGEGSGEKRHGR